jgi:hypothetical protein
VRRTIRACRRTGGLKKGQSGLITLISAAILAVTLLAFPQAPDQRAEAERLANSGAAALKQFRPPPPRT